jgi:hypothetical protein
LERSGFHRLALRVAHQFYPHCDGAASYWEGDEPFIWRLCQSWHGLSALLELPEFARPLTTSDYLEILVARHGR